MKYYAVDEETLKNFLYCYHINNILEKTGAEVDNIELIKYVQEGLIEMGEEAKEPDIDKLIKLDLLTFPISSFPQ